MRCKNINTLYEKTKVTFHHEDSEKILFVYAFDVFSTHVYAKWMRCFCSFSCPNQHASSFLHMNFHFVLLAPFLSITKFSLKVVLYDIIVVIVCMYSCIISI